LVILRLVELNLVAAAIGGCLAQAILKIRYPN
jgi:hypothetical protein